MGELFKLTLQEAWQRQSGHIVDDKKQLLKQIKELTDKVSYIRELLSSKQIEPEDFREMKSDYNNRIEKLEAKLSGLQHDDINIKDLLNKGIDNLLRLDQVYESADIDKKREVISSIFPEKFHFENNSLRTERVNEAVMCIYKINSNLHQKKRGQNKSDSVLSSQVGMTRFELATPRPPDVYATGLRHIPILFLNQFLNG